jgi:hypothetical protein
MAAALALVRSSQHGSRSLLERPEADPQGKLVMGAGRATLTATRIGVL